MIRSLIRRMVGARGGSGSDSVSTQVVLGRWGIQYDPRIIECKVFQANEDHCGCCVSAAVVATAPTISSRGFVSDSKNVDENIEEYLLPYIV